LSPSPQFSRYLGIDYSGAATADTPLTGLRVYRADRSNEPIEIRPDAGHSRHWTRRALAGWLIDELSEGPPALVGIDHGFSFPLAYFERHRLPPSWDSFLADFCRHWPTDRAETPVDLIRRGIDGNPASRSGNARWRRLTEIRSGPAKSVFHFDVPGSVAKSTHAGLPWLRAVRERLGSRAHVWPFDGWQPPAGRTVFAEVYPSIWRHRHPPGNRTPDQHDAFSVASALQDADAIEGQFAGLFAPNLKQEEAHQASIEGWILGVI